jgi:methionyl-tRNA synthetase
VAETHRIYFDRMVRGRDILWDAKEVKRFMESSMNIEQLKDVIKTALAEVPEERQDLFQEAIETALEDIALTRAIKEGEKTKPVKRGEFSRFSKVRREG